MKLIAKYSESDVNAFTSMIMRFLIFVNKGIRMKVESYKKFNLEMKYMFMIQYAENEIIQNENLRNYDFYNDLNISDKRILKLLN